MSSMDVVISDELANAVISNNSALSFTLDTLNEIGGDGRESVVSEGNTLYMYQCIYTCIIIYESENIVLFVQPRTE